MFNAFFYKLRAKGIPVSPKSFLNLQKALSMGIIRSNDDLYACGRAILIKSERYFDAYDQVFALHFQGVLMPEPSEMELTDIVKAMIEEWLKTPADIAAALDIDEQTIDRLSLDDLIKYFLDKLKEQKERHDGGDEWIGTKGTAPAGNSGNQPKAMRIGRSSRSRSAISSAFERRYKEYAPDGPLTVAQIGEALKRLRHMLPAGPKDVLNVNKTIYEIMRNGGEIEIVYDRRLLDRLEVVLMIDNGGYSMDPYVKMIQVLFSHARSQFRDLKIYYFHNSIYGHVWEDAARSRKPEPIAELIHKDPQTRLIIVGDASMAPAELGDSNGSIYVLAETFHHIAWLNPLPETFWGLTWTIGQIRRVMPMFELTLDGLERAVNHLMVRP